MAYKVTNVIDGDTFEVLPPWKWRDQSGIRVRPTGYNTPEEGQQGYQKAKERLRTLTTHRSQHRYDRYHRSHEHEIADQPV